MKTPLPSLITLSVACITQPISAADPPHLLPFQGHLARPAPADPNRVEAVPSGRYDILFTLYAAPVGGESKVWGPERHAQVTVVNGLLNALLGSIIGFENTLTTQPNFFRRPLYVGITIDADGNPNTADLELVPRQVLLPAVQALNANKLDGADWRDFFIGTDADATFTAGTTKARNADLFDGIDAAAVFVDPANTAAPKVRQAAVADGISGNLGITGDLDVSGAVNAASVAIGGPGTFQGAVTSIVSGVTNFMVPRGTIVLWSGQISSIPAGWAVCNGLNGTPDLRDRFVLGSSALVADGLVGETGGATNHTHDVNIPQFDSGFTGGGTLINNGVGSTSAATGNHNHTVNPPNTTSTAASNVPPYFRLAFIMRL